MFIDLEILLPLPIPASTAPLPLSPLQVEEGTTGYGCFRSRLSPTHLNGFIFMAVSMYLSPPPHLVFDDATRDDRKKSGWSVRDP